ncbi:hypothetical protein [Longimicrobium sp.]|nr:hypothetical protein [Longimicrobium sp.]HEX6038852.1 hypothetical protein [Longimicrobium sp.]
MEKNALNPEAIAVESFETGDSLSMTTGPMKCTGCVSGCGIIAELPYD